ARLLAVVASIVACGKAAPAPTIVGGEAQYSQPAGSVVSPDATSPPDSHEDAGAAGAGDSGSPDELGSSLPPEVPVPIPAPRIGDGGPVDWVVPFGVPVEDELEAVAIGTDRRISFAATVQSPEINWGGYCR